MADALTIVSVYPELLGTYGDHGNVLALAFRARARGIDTRILEIGVEEPLPTDGDVYVLGGGEDSAQVLAARSLFADDRAVGILGGGKPVFAVCAGLQLLSRTFMDAEGRPTPGLGLLDVDCERLDARAVGEIVTEPVDLPGVPTLTGFENHRGTARVGSDAVPLGRLVAGVGNGDDATEGARQGKVVATYLHGPALVRNPGLTDLLLEGAVGTLPAYDDALVERLRRERLDAADPRRGARRGRRGRLRRRR